MKSIERAKSFVAARPTTTKLKDDSKGSMTLEAIASLPQRSNSVCGPHAASQNAKMACIVEEVMFLKDAEGVANLAPNAACKSRVKAKTKVIVQLQSMQVKVVAIDAMLHSLQDLSDRCQRERIKVPRMRNCSKDEVNCCEHDAIIKLVVEIEQSVKIVRNSLLFLCRTFLLEKQITVLLSIQEQMYPTLDISVRFFGIDWTHIFRVSYHLKQCVDLMIETLVKGTSTAFTDVLLPSNVLRGLATIEADVSSHAEAVLHGRLSKIAQEKINLAAEQQLQRSLEITKNGLLFAAAESSSDTVYESPAGDIEVKGGRHFVGDLRRKLRKAIRLPTSVSMHGLSYFGRHSRSTEAGNGLIDKRAKSHHDALWRAWYTGLQTITIPAAAFSMSALNQEQQNTRSSPIAETTASSAASSPASSSRYLPSSSGASEPPISAVYASSSEAGGGRLRLLGDVVHHQPVAAKCEQDLPTEEEAHSAVASSSSFDAIDLDANSLSLDPVSCEELEAEAEAGNSITDDSFDSLTLTLNMIYTPKQGMAENQL